MNLYRLGTRYYDSAIGRFVNADKFVSTGTGITGFNMFSYCNNNSVNMVDYNGEMPGALFLLAAKSVVTAVMATIAAAAAVVIACEALDGIAERAETFYQIARSIVTPKEEVEEKNGNRYGSATNRNIHVQIWWNKSGKSNSK